MNTSTNKQPGATVKEIDLVESSDSKSIDLVSKCPDTQNPIPLVEFAPNRSPINLSAVVPGNAAKAPISKVPNKDLPLSYQLAEVLFQNCHFHRDGSLIYIYDRGTGVYQLLEKNSHSLIRANVPNPFITLCTPAAESDCLNWLQSKFLRDQGSLPEIKNLVPFKDCVYDLETASVLSGSREDMYLTYFNNVNILSNTSAECPVFDDYLMSVTQEDEKLATCILSMMAYTLSNCRSMKNFFLLAGPKDCGKSVCLKIMEEIIGAQYCSHIPLNSLQNRFSASQLTYARLNDVGETDSLNPKALTMLKQLTGSDTIMADVKFKNPVIFQNKAVLIFSTNKTEGFADNIHPDDPVWRRLIPLLFSYSVPLEHQDSSLLDKIRQEYPAIITGRLLPLLRKMYQNGWNFPNLDYIQDSRQLLLRPNVSVADFLKDCCDLHGDKSKCESTNTLYERYTSYCSAKGETPLGRTPFIKTILHNFSELSKTRKRPTATANAISVISGLSLCDNSEYVQNTL